MLMPRGSYWIESTVEAMLTPYRDAKAVTWPIVSTAVPTLPVAVSLHTVTHTVPLVPVVMCSALLQPRATAAWRAVTASSENPTRAERMLVLMTASRIRGIPNDAITPMITITIMISMNVKPRLRVVLPPLWRNHYTGCVPQRNILIFKVLRYRRRHSWYCRMLHSCNNLHYPKRCRTIL